MLKETEQDRESGTKQEPGQAVAPSEQAEKLAVWLVIQAYDTSTWEVETGG